MPKLTANFLDFLLDELGAAFRRDMPWPWAGLSAGTAGTGCRLGEGLDGADGLSLVAGGAGLLV